MNKRPLISIDNSTENKYTIIDHNGEGIFSTGDRNLALAKFRFNAGVLGFAEVSESFYKFSLGQMVSVDLKNNTIADKGIYEITRINLLYDIELEDFSEKKAFIYCTGEYETYLYFITVLTHSIDKWELVQEVILVVEE
jgi:hypothetical protein